MKHELNYLIEDIELVIDGSLSLVFSNVLKNQHNLYIQMKSMQMKTIQMKKKVYE